MELGKSDREISFAMGWGGGSRRSAWRWGRTPPWSSLLAALCAPRAGSQCRCAV